MLTTSKQVVFQTVGPASRSEGATTEGAAADTWNSQLMAAGGSQVPATGNIRHWNAVVGEVRRCLIPETPVDGHGKLFYTALAERCRASAVRREVVLTDHGRTCWCRRSNTLGGIQYSLQLISDRLQRRI